MVLRPRVRAAIVRAENIGAVLRPATNCALDLGTVMLGAGVQSTGEMHENPDVKQRQSRMWPEPVFELEGAVTDAVIKVPSSSGADDRSSHARSGRALG